MRRLALSSAVAALLLGGCGIVDPNDCGEPFLPAPPAGRVTIEQGVWGRVLFREGDFSPRVGGACSSGSVAPVSRTVYVFRPVTWSALVAAGGDATLHDRIPAEVVDSVRAGEDGFYQLRLPPGLYSVIAREDARFFVNHFGDTEFGLTAAPVRVPEGGVVFREIDIDYRAAY